MTMTESRRIERNQRSSASRALWRRVYRSRMNAHLEQCRRPGCSRWATVFAHIVPHVKGGRFDRSNLALLCRQCDLEQGTEVWGWLPCLLDDPDYASKMALGVVSEQA
jgi:5-methylcytosine-specific restriction endonuclease McrA